MKAIHTLFELNENLLFEFFCISCCWIEILFCVLSQRTDTCFFISSANKKCLPLN
jgi:hypothetical protein